MNHFYQTVPGWFRFLDLYAQMVREARDGAHFVEIGAYKGRSAAFMAVEIANSGKRIKFDCIDHFCGSADMSDHPEVVDGSLFEVFCRNIAPVRDRINIVRLPSVEAAKLYADFSLDFVFIDASHDFNSVLEDCAAWHPKVKIGGVLAGDDAQEKEVREAAFQWFPKTGFASIKFVAGEGRGVYWVMR